MAAMAADPIVIVTGDGPTLADWIQAGASVVSVIVAAAAAWLGWSARRAGDRAKEAGDRAEQAGKRVEQSGREAVDWAVSAGNDEVNSRLRAEGKTVWQISVEGKTTRVFTNTGSQDVKLVKVTDVTRPGEQGAAMVVPGYEGTYIAPGNGFRVLVERSVADPAVSRLEVTWEEGARTVTQIYAVS